MEEKEFVPLEQKERAIENLKKTPATMEWFGFEENEENEEAINALQVARMMQKKRRAISSVPIICKGILCPYADACELLEMGIEPTGKRCPLEIAAIEDLMIRYCSDMGINPNDQTQQVDAIMVKEIVDLDIAMLRVDKKVAISADFVIEQVVDRSDNGDIITRTEIHPMMTYKEQLRAQKYKTLSLLNSTRKDKMGTRVTLSSDPSSRATELLKTKDRLLEMEEKREQEKREYLERRARLEGEPSADVEIVISPEDVDNL